MPVRIAVNLPVRSVDRSIEFFTRLGFSIDALLTNDTTAHLVISEEISTMLVAHETFRRMTGREITEARTAAEVVVQLQLNSREHVDELVDTAIAAGGRAANPTNDQGFLYGRSFVDLDGHMWDAFHVDLASPVPPAEQDAA
jgi:predicted lactoylglutathione lyase